MALVESQRGVLRNMIAAGAVSVVLLAAAIVWSPDFLVPLAPLQARFAMTLQWDAGVFACLVAAVGNLARHRFFTPADIDGSGLTAGTDRARMLQAVLQNTLEQAVIAGFAHMLWAATMPSGWLAAIPAAVLLFVVGRLCFAIGYSGGAAARAFGFALTFYPTVFLIIGAVAAIVARQVSGV